MTIEGIRGDQADVVWFDKDEMKRNSVPLATLTPAY